MFPLWARFTSWNGFCTDVLWQLFRLCNIVLTTAALAIAIRIRIIEERSGVMGALGASP